MAKHPKNLTDVEKAQLLDAKRILDVIIGHFLNDDGQLQVTAAVQTLFSAAILLALPISKSHNDCVSILTQEVEGMWQRLGTADNYEQRKGSAHYYCWKSLSDIVSDMNPCDCPACGSGEPEMTTFIIPLDGAFPNADKLKEMVAAAFAQAKRPPRESKLNEEEQAAFGWLLKGLSPEQIEKTEAMIIAAREKREAVKAAEQNGEKDKPLD